MNKRALAQAGTYLGSFIIKLVNLNPIYFLTIAIIVSLIVTHNDQLLTNPMFWTLWLVSQLMALPAIRAFQLYVRRLTDNRRPLRWRRTLALWLVACGFLGINILLNKEQLTLLLNHVKEHERNAIMDAALLSSLTLMFIGYAFAFYAMFFALAQVIIQRKSAKCNEQNKHNNR